VLLLVLEEELQDQMVVGVEAMQEPHQTLVLEAVAVAGQVFILVQHIIWLQVAVLAVEVPMKELQTM
jgi:hypothetical protein